MLHAPQDEDNDNKAFFSTSASLRSKMDCALTLLSFNAVILNAAAAATFLHSIGRVALGMLRRDVNRAATRRTTVPSRTKRKTLGRNCRKITKKKRPRYHAMGLREAARTRAMVAAMLPGSSESFMYPLQDVEVFFVLAWCRRSPSPYWLSKSRNWNAETDTKTTRMCERHCCNDQMELERNG